MPLGLAACHQAGEFLAQEAGGGGVACRQVGDRLGGVGMDRVRGGRRRDQRQLGEGVAAMADCGCTLNNAYMQHSLLALVVIPSLRISDLGLIDVDRFAKTELFLPA